MVDIAQRMTVIAIDEGSILIRKQAAMSNSDTLHAIVTYNTDMKVVNLVFGH